MSLDYIVSGDFGQVIKLTYKDIDTNAAADISGYDNTHQMLLTDPSGNISTLTAAFDTDGTDGVIAYTLASGVIDEAGNWKIRGRVIDTGNKQLTTEEVSFLVLA